MITEQFFDLPPNLSAYAEGKYVGQNYQLIVEDGSVFLWLIAQLVPMKREFSFIARGILGSLPVSCCATQWSGPNASPIINETKIYMRSVERAENMVRVSVEQHGFTAIDIAVGIIL